MERRAIAAAARGLAASLFAFFLLVGQFAPIGPLNAAAAQDDPVHEAPDLGPPVGAALPHDLALRDSTGAQRRFDDLVGARGMALFFNRSVDWCPYCQIQVMDVSHRIEEFRARGLEPVIVTHDPIDEQATFIKRRRIAATLLSDPESEAIKAFGLLNHRYKPGDEDYGIPHPAIFIVDTQGVIRAKLYEKSFMENAKSYRKRPAIDAVLAAADQAL